MSKKNYSLYIDRSYSKFCDDIIFYLQKSEFEILRKNIYSLTDTYLLSYHIITLNIFLSDLNEYQKKHAFQIIQNTLGGLFISKFDLPKGKFLELVNKRNKYLQRYIFSLFDEFNKNSDFDMISEILDEMSEILAYDIYQNKYVDFDETTELLVIGLTEHIKIRTVLSIYVSNLTNKLQILFTQVNLFCTENNSVSNKRRSIFSNKGTIPAIIATVIFISALITAIVSGPTSSKEARQTAQYKPSISQSIENDDITKYNDSTTSTTKYTDSNLVALPLPKSGEIIYDGNTYYEDRKSQITIKSSSNNCFIKLKDRNHNDAFSFFVRANDTITVNVPKGYYYVYFAYGDTWYGEYDLFGENTRCSKDDELQNFNEYTISYTLYSVSNGNFSPEIIDVDEF